MNSEHEWLMRMLHGQNASHIVLSCPFFANLLWEILWYTRWWYMEL